MRSPEDDARLALACLDLTSLNDGDTEADIARLCDRAQGRHGRVAAVCVWPRFAAFARARLPAEIGVAAVANFPDGSADLGRAVRDTEAIVAAGAQEVDVVLPFERLRHGDTAACATLLQAVRAACPGRVLKVILETGVLQEPALIRAASILALDAGANFLKTSTGKAPVGATLPAAREMLAAIAAHPAAQAHVGFKAAGGVRTVADAGAYLAAVESVLGAAALTPARFRIGASGLLDAIEATLDGREAAPAARGY